MFKSKYKFTDGSQIWRMIISENENLVMETRNPETKEVFFHCIDVRNGSEHFKGFQTEEKFWIGIEDVYKELILFHKFEKPDMPGHKQIIAVDAASRKELWKNEDLVFLFVSDCKVYAYKQKFEGRDFFALDVYSGEIIENLGSDYLTVNELHEKSRLSKDYSDYRFPGLVDDEIILDEKMNSLFKTINSKYNIKGNIEFINYNGFLLSSFHSLNGNGSMNYIFSAFGVDNRKEIFTDTLSKSLDKFAADCFFVYKGLLFLIKEKTDLHVLEIGKNDDNG